tara:strand:- start:36113 stop:36706 length:594 start_codon:yes stop_codon:yes gene_type:complete
MLKNMRTGDLVLFSGSCRVGKLIKLLQRNMWSHVGMIVIDSNYDFPCLYESTHSDKIIDLDSKQITQGVQMVSFVDKVKLYPGSIGYRRLTNVADNELDHHSFAKLKKSLRGKAFESNILQIVKANYDGPLGANREDLSSLFCSELIAASYQTLGLLPASEIKASNEYTPSDFSCQSLKLCKSAQLSEITMIKDYKK